MVKKRKDFIDANVNEKCYNVLNLIKEALDVADSLPVLEPEIPLHIVLKSQSGRYWCSFDVISTHTESF